MNSKKFEPEPTPPGLNIAIPPQETHGRILYIIPHSYLCHYISTAEYSLFTYRHSLYLSLGIGVPHLSPASSLIGAAK